MRSRGYELDRDAIRIYGATEEAASRPRVLQTMPTVTAC
jgi:hypothetical protein